MQQVVFDDEDTMQFLNPTQRYHIVEDALGRPATELIWSVTGIGPNRKARKLAGYSRVRSDFFNRGILLKLCDRLVNVSTAEEKYLKMYYNEHYTFKAALWIPGVYDELWAAIEEKLEWEV